MSKKGHLGETAFTLALIARGRNSLDISQSAVYI